MMNVLPIDVTALVATVLGLMIVLIPVAGLTARFALKPIVEAIARARESHTHSDELRLLQQQVSLLEQQVQMLESTTERLGEAGEFHRQLGSPPA